MAKTAPRSKKTAARKAAPRRAVALVPPAVGKYWRGQGGIYAGLDRLNQHLILHPDFCKSVRFGAYRTAITGADSDVDGLKNTAALLKAVDIELALPEIIKLKLDGHRDFYVPARFQAALLYANLRDTFDRSDCYWTSTHFSDGLAWDQGFGYGGQTTLDKRCTCFVRPVRSIAHSVIR